jgi:hypothetical protein
MHRFKNILLTGLVALLMVGMVNAETTSAYDLGDNDVPDAIGIYIGIWDANRVNCIHAAGYECISVVASFDLEWIKNLFNK